MLPRHVCRRLCRGFACVGIIAGIGMESGCATARPAPLAAIPPGLSPVAEPALGGDAWRQAEAFAATLPNADVLVGSGDSMLPLYRDRTVLVVQRLVLRDLQAGMTVVFTGDQGRLVAHTLVEKTPRGWVAIGLGNAEPDRTRVRSDNYLGTVVKAFAPSDRRQRVAAAEAVARSLERTVPLARGRE